MLYMQVQDKKYKCAWMHIYTDRGTVIYTLQGCNPVLTGTHLKNQKMKRKKASKSYISKLKRHTWLSHMLDSAGLVAPSSDRTEVSRGSAIGRGAITNWVSTLLSAPRQCFSLLVAPNDHDCLSVTLTGCLISRPFSRLDETTLPSPAVWLLCAVGVFRERSWGESSLSQQAISHFKCHFSMISDQPNIVMSFSSHP